MRQITYMIGYRPHGSKTYTPVPDEAIARYTDRQANFIASRAIAEDISLILNSRCDGNQYQIFEFREVGE